MDAFDRYFRTLGLLLPRAQRDDIIRELSEELRAQAAELEALRGRPLTGEEQVALLGRMGHPLLTAARYRRSPSLIGPVVFPYYWLVIRVLVALVAVGHGLAAIMLVGSGRPVAELGALLDGLVATVLKVVGWTTVLAAVGDLWLRRSRLLETWKPAATVPRVDPCGRFERVFEAVPGSKSAASQVSIAGFIVGLIVGAWWLAGLKLPWLFFGTGAEVVGWGPAMDRVYPVLVLAQTAMLVGYLLKLTHWDSARALHALHLVWMVGGWLLVYLVVTSNHDWMIRRQGVASSDSAERLVIIAGYTMPVLDAVNYLLSGIFITIVAATVARAAAAFVRRFFHRKAAAHAT